ncbi:hypothetical protein BU23DRAFT_454833 [Bimuria novae-zelandiae CBS 107.79]|uniref:Uncharacterized protein n=1 Tax=Bimuria novae-zelandiae CBS 107.79 TaxID=1447943 RepID=A0A6A5VIJ7_9PLEO|nr:hypothetical protein BU23DRAFT_454833 [Bimuria novae-zelandiae CBS 107.79]
MLFKYISQTVKELKWKHLHRTGFIGITVDMDGKQMSGFGRYLSSIDSAHRPWQWQLQHTVKFCKAHFLRSIGTATGNTPSINNSVHQRMRDLLTCQSWEEYDTLCGLLIEHEAVPIRNWAKHKRNRVIAAGLNRHITKMAQRDWDILEETSNNVEQSAKKSYSYGKTLHLLPAIHMALKLDMRDIDQYRSHDERSVRHSERSTSLSARYHKSMGRESK